MGYFAVIDIETNWHDEMMSIGAVIADDRDFACIDSKYFIIDPCYKVGGMFWRALPRVDRKKEITCKRKAAIQSLESWFGEYGVESIFAYNATFDKGHLPEFGTYQWHDLMKIAAYNQYNRKIPGEIPCCKTGRMKSNYGVEPMMRLLSGSHYYETHNALQDAIDELKIMELLGLEIEVFRKARIS